MHYILIRKKQNKRMYLRIKNGEIVVSAPYSISKREIDAFVEKNQAWIHHQLQIHKENSLKDGDTIHTIEGDYVLHIVPNLKRISIKNGEIFVRNQKDLEKILQHLAKIILPKYFKAIQSALEFDNMHLKIGVYSSQWGSCNKMKRDIHLNAYLILTDIDFINSVIVHEFAHMYVSNHSKQFYDVVYRWLPDYNEIHQRYKNYKFPKIEP